MTNKKKRRQSPRILLNKLWDILEAEVQQDIAESLNCTQATVSLMYSSGKVSRKMKETIEVVTGGKIKKKDWLK